MMQANYHTHTKWCHHGVGEIEDYIEEAVRQGLTEIAMTEHVPHRDNVDPRRMQWEEFEAYNEVLDQAVEQYSDRIRIIKGFEAEYYAEEMEAYARFRKEYGYQLFILAQHNYGPDHQYDAFCPKGETEVRAYTDELCAGVRSGFFDFVAHPDLMLVGYSAGWDALTEESFRTIYATCEACDMPIEINANGLRNGKEYPSREALLLSKEYNLRYLVSSDAHDPSFLMDEYVHRAEELAAELEIAVMQRLRL